MLAHEQNERSSAPWSTRIFCRRTQPKWSGAAGRSNPGPAGAHDHDLCEMRRDQQDEGPQGPVPEDNQPGHHPEVEQDKPTGPPPVA